MNPTLQTLHTLRSTHGNFTSRDITENDLKSILDAALRTATASALQSYSIIVVKDRKTILEAFDYPGSVALLFCVDHNRLMNCAGQLGMTMKESGIISFLRGATDTILAAQTAAIAARSLDIDSLFTNSVHRHKLDEVYETFHLPKSFCFPMITLVLGYADHEPDHLRGRVWQGVVHEGHYQRMDTAEIQHMIEAYDDKDLNLSMISGWQEKGYKHYLEWLFTEWMGRSPDTVIEEFRDRLKASEFW